MVATTQGCELPRFVRDLLGTAPKVGEGVNSWLFRVARVLHPYRSEPEIVTLLESATHGEHIRSGEIERAVRNSKAAAWQPGEPIPRVGSPAKWPEANAEEIRRINASGPTVTDLLQMTPGGCGMDEDDGKNCASVVSRLFGTPSQPDPLVCIGKSKAEFATRPLSVWMSNGKLPTSTLIVPSPMSKRIGLTKEGKESEHCLDNTGPRRFLVLEFDRGTVDDHAARLWHLAAFAPLVLVVHSGGKSLHGWFYCQGQSETVLRKFMAYAVSLGGDDATWTRSQFVRLPGGLRDGKTRQSVFYFDPGALK